MWDRGKPSPALIDLVEYRKELFQPLAADGRRKKALVPVWHHFRLSLALLAYSVY
jgi:hypothetical protein